MLLKITEQVIPISNQCALVLIQEYFNKSSAWTGGNNPNHAYDFHLNNDIYKETQTYSMVMILNLFQFEKQ